MAGSWRPIDGGRHGRSHIADDRWRHVAGYRRQDNHRWLVVVGCKLPMAPQPCASSSLVGKVNRPSVPRQGELGIIGGLAVMGH